MTSRENLPQSGYVLDRVIAYHQGCEVLPPSDEFPDQAETPLTIGWNWSVLGEAQFQVLLSVVCGPTRSRHERVRVDMVAVFSIIGEVVSTNVLDFVRNNGPAILFPYVRETVASLTGRAVGTLHLAPVNIQNIMRTMNIEQTTGYEQLRAEPNLLGKQVHTVSSALLQ